MASLKRGYEQLPAKHSAVPDVVSGSLTSEEGSYISKFQLKCVTDKSSMCSLLSLSAEVHKPQSLAFHSMGSSTENETLSSSPNPTNAQSPYYYRASDVRHIADIFRSHQKLPALPRPRPPPLQYIKGESSDSHDYESLHFSMETPEEEEVTHEGKKRKYTKIKIAGTPDLTPTSPPYVPEGGKQSLVIGECRGITLCTLSPPQLPEFHC